MRVRWPITLYRAANILSAACILVRNLEQGYLHTIGVLQPDITVAPGCDYRCVHKCGSMGQQAFQRIV